MIAICTQMNLFRQDKAQHAMEYGQETPIPIQEIFEVARVTLEVARQLRQQQ